MRLGRLVGLVVDALDADLAEIAQVDDELTRARPFGRVVASRLYRQRESVFEGELCSLAHILGVVGVEDRQGGFVVGLWSGRCVEESEVLEEAGRGKGKGGEGGGGSVMIQGTHGRTKCQYAAEEGLLLQQGRITVHIVSSIHTSFP